MVPWEIISIEIEGRTHIFVIKKLLNVKWNFDLRAAIEINFEHGYLRASCESIEFCRSAFSLVSGSLVTLQ